MNEAQKTKFEVEFKSLKKNAYYETLKFASTTNYCMGKISGGMILCEKSLHSFAATASRRDGNASN